MLTSIALYLALGCCTGMLAGLLGIGGGVIIVPLQGINGPVNLLALGTSMASTLFISIASVREHNRHKTVLWPVVFRLAPGVVTGTLLGGFLVVFLPGRLLSAIFVIFLSYVACQMLLDITPKPSRHLPGAAGIAGIGVGIGVFSSFVGISGGTLIIPFLTLCNTPMREAVATSAGVGLPLALAGTAIYLVQGWGAPGLPPHSFGFIYLPALVGLVCASMLTAPLGAKLAYRVPVPRLKRFFAVFLLFVAVNLLRKIIDFA